LIREIAPSARLREWVDAFWMRDASGPDVSPAVRVLPDNCADALFDLGRAEGFVVGTMTASIVVPAGETPARFGMRFRPGRARTFFGAPLQALTDRRVALNELGVDSPLAGEVAEQLAEAAGDRERVRIAEAAIERRLMDAEAPDRRVDAAISRLTATNESIDELARTIGITRQHLRRRFLEQVGITPKTFARVARFRRLLVDARETASWATLAVEHGYFDQSHLIAEFRELAGSSPVPFFQSL
jgi:AraC-like DNA-binding protein